MGCLLLPLVWGGQAVEPGEPPSQPQRNQVMWAGVEG